jgi:hypothetical protein
MWPFNRKKVEIAKPEVQKDVEIKYDKTVLLNIRDFLLQNPQILYKGVPLAVAIYVLYPLIVGGIAFLPYLWAMYYCYSITPSWAVTAVTLYFKREKLMEHIGNAIVKK